MSLTVVYASRFGTTAKLAATLANQLGPQTQLVDISAEPNFVPVQATILLTAIIWDRPLPSMRTWLAEHATAARQHAIACGVVCGSAGVRPNGGLIYAKNFAKRLGKPEVYQFALSGQIPNKNQMRGWEWLALKAFAAVMRKPQLFTIQADIAKAKHLAGDLLLQLR